MMYKVSKLTLITGIDILMPEYEVKIHQPTINEIALIGEEMFFSSLSIFMIEIDNFKTNLTNFIQQESNNEDTEFVTKLTEFEIVLFLLNSDPNFLDTFKTIMGLLIKDYDFRFSKEEFKIFLENEKNTIELDEQFFMTLKDIVYKIFIFDKFFDSAKYNPANEAAAKIAKKLAKAKEKIKDKNSTQEHGLFANMISILGTTNHNISDLNNFTIYQLYNQFERYSLYLQYDQSMKAALAGAQVDIVDWFKQL